jgi:hypothetical protein
VKAGGFKANHNQGVPVKSGVKAGGFRANHNQAGVSVTSSVKAGVRSGGVWGSGNHNQTAAAR